MYTTMRTSAPLQHISREALSVLQAHDGTFYGTDNRQHDSFHAARITQWAGGPFKPYFGLSGTIPVLQAHSVVGDPVVDRTVPPTLFLNANLLNAAGGNVAGTGTTLPGKDDPWSLRLVPTRDDGAKGQSERFITYNLFALDGKSNPQGSWLLPNTRPFRVWR
jgi:hypothetical protein